MASTESKKPMKLDESFIFLNLLIQLQNKIQKNTSKIDYEQIFKLISALGVKDYFQDFVGFLSTKLNLSKDKIIEQSIEIFTMNSYIESYLQSFKTNFKFLNNAFVKIAEDQSINQSNSITPAKIIYNESVLAKILKHFDKNRKYYEEKYIPYTEEEIKRIAYIVFHLFLYKRVYIKDQNQTNKIIKNFLLKSNFTSNKIEDILKLFMDYLNENNFILKDNKIDFNKIIQNTPGKEEKKSLTEPKESNLNKEPKLLNVYSPTQHNKEIFNKYKENIKKNLEQNDIEGDNLKPEEKIKIYTKFIFKGLPISFEKNKIPIENIQAFEDISSGVIGLNQNNIKEFHYNYPNFLNTILNALANINYELKEISQIDIIKEEIHKLLESKKAEITKIIDSFSFKKSSSGIDINKCFAKILLEMNIKLSNLAFEEKPISSLIIELSQNFNEMDNENKKNNFDSIFSMFLYLITEKKYLQIIKLTDNDIAELNRIQNEEKENPKKNDLSNESLVKTLKNNAEVIENKVEAIKENNNSNIVKTGNIEHKENGSLNDKNLQIELKNEKIQDEQDIQSNIEISGTQNNKENSIIVKGNEEILRAKAISKEKIPKVIEEIFKFYCHQKNTTGRKIKGENYKFSVLDLLLIRMLISDFEIPLDKNKIREIFKKISGSLNYIEFSKFIDILKSFAIEIAKINSLKIEEKIIELAQKDSQSLENILTNQNNEKLKNMEIIQTLIKEKEIIEKRTENEHLFDLYLYMGLLNGKYKSKLKGLVGNPCVISEKQKEKDKLDKISPDRVKEKIKKELYLKSKYEEEMKQLKQGKLQNLKGHQKQINLPNSLKTNEMNDPNIVSFNKILNSGTINISKNAKNDPIIKMIIGDDYEENDEEAIKLFDKFGINLGKKIVNSENLLKDEKKKENQLHLKSVEDTDLKSFSSSKNIIKNVKSKNNKTGDIQFNNNDSKISTEQRPEKNVSMIKEKFKKSIDKVNSNIQRKNDQLIQVLNNLDMRQKTISSKINKQYDKK